MSKTNKLFEGAAECVLDAFWKDILQGCAKGKFPRGVRYNSTNHTFSIKMQKRGKSGGGIEVIELRSDPNELAQDTLSIFRDKLDLYSSIDLKIKKDEFNTSSDLTSSSETQELKWKSIKPKYRKDLLITNFVISLKRKYGISDSDASELGTNISFAIQLKSIGPDNIHFEDGVISHIDGVEYDSEQGKVIINNSKCKAPLQLKTKKMDLVPKKSAILQNTAKYAKVNNLRIKAITET